MMDPKDAEARTLVSQELVQRVVSVTSSLIEASSRRLNRYASVVSFGRRRDKCNVVNVNLGMVKIDTYMCDRLFQATKTSHSN